MARRRAFSNPEAGNPKNLYEALIAIGICITARASSVILPCGRARDIYPACSTASSIYVEWNKAISSCRSL